MNDSGFLVAAIKHFSDIREFQWQNWDTWNSTEESSDFSGYNHFLR